MNHEKPATDKQQNEAKNQQNEDSKVITPVFNENANIGEQTQLIRPDAAIITEQRIIARNNQKLNQTFNEIGEFACMMFEAIIQGVPLRKETIGRQQALRKTMDELYGKGSMISEDGESIIFPNTQPNDQNSIK